jgi:tetratricopeptide (TPR) repeat protein
MLSTPYADIKRLRSTGNCAGAIAKLSAQPPASDEDAFEAAICLLVCGQPENAVHVSRTYPWKSGWARQISTAFADLLVGGNDERALAAAKAVVADPAAPHDTSAVYLLGLQKQGLIAEAEAFIARRWSDLPLGETLLLTLMAEIAVAAKDWRQAFRCACGVLAADPDDYRALIALGIANYEDGNLHESLGNARRANALSPGSAPAILQIMRCENKLGDHYAAVAAFDKLADPNAVAPGHQVELGRAYAGLEDRARATEAYRTALAADPKSVEAIRALAQMHATAGETAALQALAEQYPQEFRRDVESLYWEGLASVNGGELDRAERVFRESFALSERRGEALDALPWPVPEPRLRHDYEQLELLARRGKLDSAGRDALKVLKPYYDRSGDPRTTFAPAGAEAQALKRALATHYHVPAEPFAGAALGENDYTEIEDRYFSKRLAVIDNFLSPRALAALRVFSEEATVWKSYNRHGYVGALVAVGFSPKVLLAIAEELKRAMPRVIGDQPLLQAWGYKYDQRLQGINMHADFAKVNVNFWLTADDACLDRESGGMVVYDLPVPKSWTFADYNTDPGRLASYVRLHGAQPLRVTHRANRCVIFDSSLIHVTDRMVFKPGYENRRMNVTLLYGQGLSVE